MWASVRLFAGEFQEAGFVLDGCCQEVGKVYDQVSSSYSEVNFHLRTEEVQPTDFAMRLLTGSEEKVERRTTLSLLGEGRGNKSLKGRTINSVWSMLSPWCF